jgi:hypothetical protein
MGIIGSLLVELGINSAAFKSGCDKSTYMARQMSNDLKKSFDEVGASFKELGNQLGASFGPLGSVLSATIKGIDGVGASISAASKGASGLQVLAGAAAGIGGAVIAAAAGFGTMSQAGSKLAEELINTSKKLGMTVQQVAGLKLAAEYVNLPVETLTRGFARFSKELGALGSEHGTQATAMLKNLGITAGTGTYDGFSKAATAIQKMHDPVQQMTYATSLFGQRLGLQLLPMLEDSSTSMDEFAEMAKKAGLALDSEAIERTEHWKKATVGLSAAWDGLKLSLSNQDWVTKDIELLSTAVGWATKLASAKTSATPYEDQLRAEHTGEEGDTGPSDKELERARAMDALQSASLAKQTAIKAAGDNAAQSAATALISKYEAQYDRIKAGGAAQEALAAKEREIEEMVEGANSLRGAEAAAKWKEVAAAEALVPALKEAAKEEKDFFETQTKMLRTIEEIEKANDKLNAQGSWAKIMGVEAEKAKTPQQEQDEMLKQISMHAVQAAEAMRGLGDAIQASSKAGMEQSHKGAEDQLARQHALGLISERQYQQGLAAIYAQELKDEQKLIQDKIAAAQAQAGGASVGDAGNTAQQNEALTRVIQLQAQLNALTVQYDEKLQRVNTDLAKNPFTQFAAEAKNSATVMQSSMVTAMNGIAAGFAKTIVEGKNMGQALRGVAKQFAESFIEMEIKRLMAHVMTETGITTATVAGNTVRTTSDKTANMASILGSAKSAAAKGWNAGESFPFPIDLVMAPALAAGAFAGVMAFGAFEKGGIVPETGMNLLHKNEMVLPAPIAQKVTNMADGGGGSRGGTTVNVNHTSHTQALDGKGVGAILSAHSEEIASAVLKSLRRRNMV